MKFIVTGANPKTGTELTREVEAVSAKDAEKIAREKGLWVAKVSPAVQEAQPITYATPVGLPLKHPPVMVHGPNFICPNANCGYQGPSSKTEKGSQFVGFLLLLLAIVPGIVYLVLCCGSQYHCPRCGCEVKL